MTDTSSGTDTNADAATNASTVLADAEAAATAMDLKYRAASFDDQMDMKESRDDLFAAYVEARSAVLSGGVTVTDADVAAMAELRQQMESAAQTQQLITAAARAAAFLVRLAT